MKIISDTETITLKLSLFETQVLAKAVHGAMKNLALLHQEHGTLTREQEQRMIALGQVALKILDQITIKEEV